ncbi:transglycosylase SLT domain-containing protein [Bacteroidales bacterium OttesenSCG-928-I21]|nr:transglycosylase SLT domain-containing protein [Bacteroidales bacterium OttesenSCG-928-I21]
MKKIYLIIIFFSITIHNLYAIKDSDTTKFSKKNIELRNCQIVDNLDSLLNCWFYFIGRDSIVYLAPEERYTFVNELADSIYEERIKKIVSPIELSYNEIVQQHLNIYIKNGRWMAPKFLGLSHQYFPLFEEKLDAYDLPLEIKYLAIVESALNPRAKSKSGATGLWQFMHKTAQSYGVEINSYVDERMDPVISTEIACKFLKNLYETYNDWILAIAAYNCGPGTLNNAIRRAGGKTNYWEIYPYLPHETRNYIPRFIAITYMFNYAEEHNFKPEYIPFYDDVDTVMICKELHFAQLDSVLGISVFQSRELNPQYKLDIIPAKNKCYPLKMRRQYIARFIELEDSIYRFQDTLFFNPNKYNYKPNEKYVDYVASTAQPEGTELLTYTVKSGDVIGLIASWYDVRHVDLKAWNGLNNNKIRVGQTLKIYVPNGKKDRYKDVDKMSFEEKQRFAGVSTQTNQEEEPLDASYEYYTVKAGDNPYNIASRFDDVSVDEIMKLNGITNPSGLKIGQKLKIKKIIR